jgi:hypothetical protein
MRGCLLWLRSNEEVAATCLKILSYNSLGKTGGFIIFFYTSKQIFDKPVKQANSILSEPFRVYYS